MSTIITNGYCTLTAFKARQKITDTTQDVYLARMIEAAARKIDAYCGRWFYSTTAVKYYSADDGRHCYVDDLISVTALGIDASGHRDYDIALANTDYEVEPYNARQMVPARPYTGLRITPYSSQWFPVHILRSVKVTGLWGYSDFTAQVTTVGTAGITNSATSLPVVDGTQIEVGHILLIGSEQLYADAVNANTVTVRRAANGTTAAAHVSGDAVNVYQFGAIDEVNELLAARLWKRKDTPLGVSANSQLGPLMLKVPGDQDIVDILEGYRRLT